MLMVLCVVCVRERESVCVWGGGIRESGVGRSSMYRCEWERERSGSCV